MIELPGVPRGKGRPRFTRTGFAFTPPDTRKYEAALAKAGQAAMVGRPPFNAPVVVVVTARFSIPQSWPKHRKADALKGIVQHTVKPDIDNVLKMALDGLNGVVWSDDKIIVRCMARKVYGTSPGLVVSVQPLDIMAEAA